MGNGEDWRSVLARISSVYVNGKADGGVLSRIKSKWSAILRDEALERFCVPEYFENGVLGVKANSAAAASLMLMRKDEVLANARIALPSLEIKNIMISR